MCVCVCVCVHILHILKQIFNMDIYRYIQSHRHKHAPTHRLLRI